MNNSHENKQKFTEVKLYLYYDESAPHKFSTQISSRVAKEVFGVENGDTLKIPVEIVEDDKTVVYLHSDEITAEKVREQEEIVYDFVVTEFRPLFKYLAKHPPKKDKPMGNRAGAIRKMALWTLMYPEYSQKEILDAAKKYIKKNLFSLYARNAEYFIMKQVQDTDGRNLVISDLLTTLEHEDLDTAFDEMTTHYKMIR